jgi:GMP synthase-like glutamine amidotransferase
VTPILLVRNDGFETFGVAPGALARAGMDLVTANMTDPTVELPPLDDVAGVITFGGTVNVDQVDEYPHLGVVRQYTREAVDRGVPYLGICLGSQILARALGIEVVKGPVKEVGFEPVRLTPDAKEDALLSFLEPEERVLQWHEDTHELPDGAALLITADPIPVQAYRVGETAWGVQFHLEVEAWELAWWLEVADVAMDLRATWGKSADDIRAEAERHMPRQEERGREIFTRFADIVRSTHSR